MPITVNTAPVELRVRPSRSRRSSEKVPSKALNATIATKATRIMRRTSGGSPRGSKAGRPGTSSVGAGPGWVSGRRRSATTALIEAMAAAMKNGMCGPPNAAKVAMAGPSTNPTPKAAPSSPNKPGAVLVRGHVGHRRLGHRHARPGRPVDEPAEQEQPHRPGDPRDHAPDGGAAEGHDEDRLAPVPVRQPSHHGGGDQLRQREAGHHQPDHRRRDVEVLGVAREDREDDPEPDEVDRDRGPDRPEPGRQGPPAISSGSPPGSCAEGGHGELAFVRQAGRVKFFRAPRRSGSGSQYERLGTGSGGFRAPAGRRCGSNR